MRWKRRFPDLWRLLFQRKQLEDELDEELRSCFDILVDRYLAKGMSPSAARRAARLDFEGIEHVKDNVRDQLTGWPLELIRQDALYALRTLKNKPAFASIAIVTLSLGIAVITAVFSIGYAVLLKPLPYDHPDRLALIWAKFEKMGADRAPVSGVILNELQHRSRTLQSAAGIWVGSGVLTGNGEPEQLKMGQVTPNFFQTLGVQAALGRTFVPEERAGGRRAIILTDQLWRQRFSADPQIVGKSIPFAGASMTVVGVLPSSFQLRFPQDANVPSDVQVFTPFPQDITKDPPTLYYIRILARLKADATPAQAQQDLDAIALQLRKTYEPYAIENLNFQPISLHADAVRPVRPAILSLLAGAALVLCICCVNVASLLLGRVSERRYEIALRTALGASRARIIQQLLIEGLVLCSIAGIVGLALASALIRGIVIVQPESLARLGAVALDWHVLAFTGFVTLGAALLLGLTPAIESKSPAVGPLREARSSPRVRGAARGLLITGEVMLAFVLVIGAGLMIRTLSNIIDVNPGFQPQRLLTFELEIGRLSIPSRINFIREWEAALRSLPGVQAAGSVSHLPLDDYPNWYSAYRPEGSSNTESAALLADYRSVSPEGLRAMGTRLIEGRAFDSRDQATTQPVVIIDESLARSAWPGQSAIGRTIEAEHFTPQGFQTEWAKVVGVVEHVRMHSLTRETRSQVYIPFEQSPRWHMSFVVRTSRDPMLLAPAIRRELARINPTLAASKIRPMTSYVQHEVAPASFTAALSAVFAVLALALAGIGVYGLLYYSVSRRTREMAVRMSLGATTQDLIRMVMTEGLQLIVPGLALGIAAAILASRYLQSLVYGVSPLDPFSYLCALALLTAAGVIGCWQPAWRASKAAPAQVLRAE